MHFVFFSIRAYTDYTLIYHSLLCVLDDVDLNLKTADYRKQYFKLH